MPAVACASDVSSQSGLVWSVFKSNGVDEQKTLHLAKDRLIAASFKSNLNTITRKESINPGPVDEQQAPNHPRVDKRIRLLEAKIDNLTRVIARMNK